MRRALAHEIRQIEKAPAAHRHLCHSLIDELIGINTLELGLFLVIIRKIIPEPFEGKARCLRDAHDVPAARHCTAERMHTSLRVDAELARMGKHHAARADGRKGPAILNDACAYRSCSVIPRAADNNRRSAQAGPGRKFRSDCSGNLGRFIDLRQQRRVDCKLFQDFCRPAALRDIQKLHAACIGNLRCIFSGHAEADIILRQQDMAAAAVVLCLMIAYPEDFGSRESRKRRIRRNLNETFRADAFRDFLTFLRRALIAPDNRRPDDFIGLIQHHKTMHLSGKPDALDVISLHSRLLHNALDCRKHCTIPVQRFLLRPAILRLAQCIFL